MAHRNRLTTREFNSVFDSGQRLGHKWFTLRVLPHSATGRPAPRWGFAVGKRLAKSSVERNRLRRRLRVAVNSLDVPGDVWYVVQLRPAGMAARPVELREAIVARLALASRVD